MPHKLSTLIRRFAILMAAVPCLCLAQAPSPTSRVSVKPKEMLTNGSFAAGTQKWTLEEAGSAKGTMEVTKEGPKGISSLKVKIVAKGEQSWQVQLHQGGLKIEKGRPYRLTYWVKADRPGLITVNCMQNHEPWEHHGAAMETAVTTTWKQMTFNFSGPWKDANARVTFTNLATTPGQTYWFSNISLQSNPPKVPTLKKAITQSTVKPGGLRVVNPTKTQTAIAVRAGR